MLHLFDFFSDIHLIDLVAGLPNDFYHWLEAVGVEELLVELTVHNREGECATFHDRHAVDKVARRPLFQGLQLLLDFQYFAIEALDIIGQKFDVILTILECLELQIDELLWTNPAILVCIHLLVNGFYELGLYFLARGARLRVHEVAELLAV